MFFPNSPLVQGCAHDTLSPLENTYFMAIESKMHRGPIGSKQQPQKSSSWVVIVGVILLGLLAGAWFYFNGETPEPTDTLEVEEVAESGEYQAVFLDNGQVYFGALDDSDKRFYTLTDVFYLQSGVVIDQSSNIALAKLGNEAHGPEDEMRINVDHILFIEDMRSDSSVVQAIREYKANN
jgi:hypothetical protein